MDAKEYKTYFLENVKVDAAASGEGSCAVFMESMANQLIEQDVITDFIPAFYEGEGIRRKKFRVDGYCFDEFDETMNLFIANYNGIDEKTITKTVIKHDIEQLSYFVNRAQESDLYREIEISTPCSDLVDLLRLKRKDIRRYRAFLFTDGQLSKSVTVVDDFKFDGVYTEVQVWDIERMFNVYANDTEESTVTVDFTEFTDLGIPCLEASQAGTEEYKGYLCVIPGTVIADIYDKYGSKLLEGNVRSFLSSKVAVNKKIRETIRNKPDKFFAFNNGISATALEVGFNNTPSGKYIKSARSFQIINGGQTTASLSNTRHKDGADLSGIFVQMKLTEIGEMSEDQAAELIQNISRSSNSQNKVSEADFFATHPFHIRMEQISRRLLAPAQGGSQYNTKWFYERARGQYTQATMHSTKAEKKKFEMLNPPSQKMTKTDLAKYRNSWEGQPHYVSKGAQTNFMKYAESVNDAWESDDNQFNDVYYQETVAIAIMFKYLEKAVSSQPWYEGGYRANIVTYTIALFHKLIRDKYKKKDLDLNILWMNQAVPDEIKSPLLRVAKLVCFKITEDDRPVQNVTQWCKQQACWERVSHLDIDFEDDIERFLIDVSKDKQKKKSAKKDRKFVSEIEGMTEVINVGAEKWNDLMKFIENLGIASSDEISALRVACNIPKKIPNGVQCKKIMSIKEKAIEEGYKW